MIADGIREFVARDWAAVRDAKDAWWGTRIARLGPLEGFRAAEALRQQVLGRCAGWPTPDLRQEDLAAHQRLADLLRRADAARRR